MKTSEAEARLRTLLTEAGVDVDRPVLADLDRAWAAWRRFATDLFADIADDPDADGILATYGTWDWGDGPEYEVAFTRQFSFTDADGEYDHMTQLECTFTFAPTDGLRAAGEHEHWSFDVPIAEFFDRALASPGFQAPARLGLQPVGLRIAYEEV